MSDKHQKPKDRSFDYTISFRNALSATHRTREILVTSALWVVYGYLWLPVISLLAWYYGIDFAYEMVLAAGGQDALIGTLIWFSIVFLLVLLVIVSWSGFQYSKFKGKKDRRNSVATIDPIEERDLWQIDEALQAQIKANKIQTISLGDDSRINFVI
jgi:biofilm PGA synthesis protein PgaD